MLSILVISTLKNYKFHGMITQDLQYFSCVITKTNEVFSEIFQNLHTKKADRQMHISAPV